MIPFSDVDVVIVDNDILLEKVDSLLRDTPWIQKVNVGLKKHLNLAHQWKCRGPKSCRGCNRPNEYFNDSYSKLWSSRR